MRVAFLLPKAFVSGGTNILYEHVSRMVSMGATIYKAAPSRPDATQEKWFKNLDTLIWLAHLTVLIVGVLIAKASIGFSWHAGGWYAR